MDTDKEHRIVTTPDPAERQVQTVDSAQEKRRRMRQVCSHCHTESYIDAFYRQYDDFVILYNEKFAKPGQAILDVLLSQGVRSPTQFDEEIEWTWFYLWHHEGRRARHGASMMAPDYAHWHGMFEVAERFYMELIPQAEEMAEEAGGAAGQAVLDAIERILERPEHAWFREGAESDAERIRREMEQRYGSMPRREDGGR